jgi:hypothetical protein
MPSTGLSLSQKGFYRLFAKPRVSERFASNTRKSTGMSDNVYSVYEPTTLKSTIHKCWYLLGNASLTEE